jgi:alpha-glucosidase
MLAMYVVLENANAMVCDYPEAYENQPGFDFLQSVPTTWDKTVVIDGKPDQYLLIARKKNQNWWIAGITGDSSRTLKFRPVFSNEDSGPWKLSLYQDDVKTPFNPNGVLISTMQANQNTTLEIPMAAGGGFVIKLVKQ